MHLLSKARCCVLGLAMMGTACRPGSTLPVPAASRVGPAPTSRQTPAADSTSSRRPTQPVFSPSALIRNLRNWCAETDPLKQDALLKELLAGVTDANVAAIVRTLSPDLLATPFGEIVLKRWASLDHLAAAKWIETLPGGASELQAGLVTYGWLAEHRDELHAYVDALSPGTWRNQVITAATNDALLLKNGPEAVSLLLRLPPAGQRNEMLGWASTQWAMQAPDRAAEWVGTVSDPGLQGKLFGAVAIGYAWTKPEKAAELLLSSGLDADTDLTPVKSVMNIWSAKDPAAAATWACTQLKGETQRQAVRCAVTAWGNHDLAAAKKWIESLPAGDLRSQAERTAAKVTAARAGQEISDE